MAEQLIEKQAEQIVEKLKQLALAGDVTCLKIMVRQQNLWAAWSSGSLPRAW
jgi:hypothetical protein